RSMAPTGSSRRRARTGASPWSRSRAPSSWRAHSSATARNSDLQRVDVSLDPETATGGRAHRQRPPLVRLIPVGDVDPALLDAIRPGIATRFHAPVRIGAPIALHPAWFDDA